MPFLGNLFLKLKRKLSGLVDTTGQVSTTLFANRKVSGSASFSGFVKIRVLYRRNLAGAASFTGATDLNLVQVLAVSGTASNFSGIVSVSYTAGKEINLKGLYKLGNSLRLR